ncbi:hypothetical protein DPMN_124508 [Dreissena polymorpha]|uniref:Uncharacterized protein n=1 Tax=Dreissena polymorpha TaxID=45954 RepID=A0A9D4GVQ4_DREPO|nr:hypothetical protein DPMN_124508 [Dreissena polymorpha]
MPDKLVETILVICWKAGLDEACLLRWALGDHDQAVALKQLVAMDITRMSIVPVDTEGLLKSLHEKLRASIGKKLRLCQDSHGFTPSELRDRLDSRDLVT